MPRRAEGTGRRRTGLLLGLAEERGSLEDVFVHLTTREDVPAPGAASPGATPPGDAGAAPPADGASEELPS